MTRARFARLAGLSLNIALIFVIPSLSSCFIPVGKAPLVSPRNIPSISRIEILSPGLGYPISLERRGESWELSVGDTARFPASDAKVALALSALEGLSHVETVRGIAGSYGVDAGLSTRVIAKDAAGKVLLDVLEGTASVTGSFRYYLDARTSRVFRSIPLDALTDTRTAYWADLSPFARLLSGREIERIRYRRGSETTVLSRGATSLEDNAIDGFTKALETLNCVDVTNYPAIPDVFIDLWLSDLSVVSLKIARLREDRAAIGFVDRDGMWILTGRALESLAEKAN